MQATRYWLPRACGLLSFLWFAVMAAPGFFWLDSAELSSAGIGLGSPHPSGFPLYMMLIKAASLIPVGELAFRVNLLSAACAAYAIGGVARLVLVMGKEDWGTVAGAIGAAGVLCFSFLFARHATIAEVYAPTAAFLVLTLSLFERVAHGSSAGAGLSLAWVAGLGFAVHPEYRMLMGLPILALLALRVYRGARWPLLAPGIAIFAALASYLYLPVRSATGRIATLDWGHPRTFSAVWNHASGSEVRKAFDDQMLSGTREIVMHDASTFVGQVLDHLGVIAVLAGIVGLVVVLAERRTRWMGVAIAGIAILDFLYASWINPMGLIDLQNGVPMAVALSLGAGVALGTLARSSGRAAPFTGAVVAMFMIVPPALSSVPRIGLVGDLPRHYSESAFEDAPVRALLLSQSDSLSAGASFLQTVEGLRPDMASLVVPMFADGERIDALLNQTERDGLEGTSREHRGVERVWRTGRPFLWEPGPSPRPGNTALEHGPVVGRLVPANEGRAPTATMLARLGRLYEGSEAKDPSARRAIASSLTYLGRSALAYGEMPLAEQLFWAAVEVRPGHAVALVNIGVMYSRTGKLESAAEVTERALESEPNRLQALLNAARYRLALGELDKAQTHAERALAIAPKSPASWTMAGLVEMQSGNTARARERLEKALEISPQYSEAREALEALGPSARH